jgi:phosphoribosylformylglycinamidine synthase subunit PurL
VTQATQQPLHRALGLTDAEYAQIEKALERAPNDFELAVYSLLWSEHCGYKHSRLELRRLPTNGPRVLQGPGENAGVIDVGDGLAVAFKVESHNHPSAVEPYQGAATGVGGILRDIFAMGARPIALGDSLRLGPLDEERPRELFRGIVRGIGGYGNCVGVPNVVGETVFDAAYRSNPLVNALCIGLLRADELVRASATGPGNLVVLFGATTGRDGIGGASVLASQDLDESDEDKRPTVQVGDPFTGKKLIECTLELARLGLVVSVQDLGAAGLASSTSEMAASGGVGIELDLDLVPLREQAMEPFEIMISESQERMAAIVEPARLAEVEAVCARWQLPCTAIGHVTDDGRLRCRWDGEVVGDMLAESLADAPRYPLHAERPAALSDQSIPAAEVPAIDDPAGLLLRLLAAPDICAKTWVYEQYDQVVGSGTVARPGGDAGVVRLTPSERAIAVALDGDGARVALDPRRGGAEAVAQAALNVACSGAVPAAITNCLNFGNPERSGTAYALREAITGMAEACEVLGTPVVSGNVSLYNESGGRPIHPTPVVGCVGVLENAAFAVPAAPADGTGTLFALGTATPLYDGSEWQALIAGEAAGRIPEVDLPALRWLCDLLAESARDGLLRSAHDVSDGGLAVALAEIALAAGTGLDVTVDPGEGDAATALFGECCGLVVVSCAQEDEERLSEACDSAGVPFERIGTLGGATIAVRCGALALAVAPEDARAAYEDTLPQAMAAG